MRKKIRSEAFRDVVKNADKIMVGGKDGDKAVKKAYRKGAAKAAAKAVGKAAKSVAKRIGPLGAAYGAYEVSQGRVPVASDAKDAYEWMQTDEAKMIGEAFKEDPVGMTTETAKEVGRSVKRANKEMVEEANERRSRDYHKKQKSVEGFAKGGEVKKRLARGCGIAVQGTKFRGVK